VGRPRSEGAQAHAAIMDAAYILLQRTSVRDLTMDAIAKEAGVGKATLYKWWPSKVALVFAMFHERLDHDRARLPHPTPEDALRARALRLIGELDGLFGKVVVELIAEGQSERAFLDDFYHRYVRERRDEGIAWIEQAQAAGRLHDGVEPELLIDQIFGAIYYRRLLGIRPLDLDYGSRLVDQVLGTAKV
jgi:AcrR family transcriptional regulator